MGLLVVLFKEDEVLRRKTKDEFPKEVQSVVSDRAASSRDDDDDVTTVYNTKSSMFNVPPPVGSSMLHDAREHDDG